MLCNEFGRACVDACVRGCVRGFSLIIVQIAFSVQGMFFPLRCWSSQNSWPCARVCVCVCVVLLPNVWCVGKGCSTKIKRIGVVW